MTPQNRTQFTFYKSFYDVYKLLNNEQKVEFLDNLFQVEFLEKKYEDIEIKDPMVKMAWASQKHSIEVSLTRYISNRYRDIVKNKKLGVYSEDQKEKTEDKKSETKTINNTFFDELWGFYKKVCKDYIGSKDDAFQNFKQLELPDDIIKKAVVDYARYCNNENQSMKKLSEILDPDFLENYIKIDN